MTLAILCLTLLTVVLLLAVLAVLHWSSRLLVPQLIRIDEELRAIHASHEQEAQSRRQRMAEFMERRGSGRDLLAARLAARLQQTTHDS
jgi:hypothetical protein